MKWHVCRSFPDLFLPIHLADLCLQQESLVAGAPQRFRHHWQRRPVREVRVSHLAPTGSGNIWKCGWSKTEGNRRSGKTCEKREMPESCEVFSKMFTLLRSFKHVSFLCFTFFFAKNVKSSSWMFLVFYINQDPETIDSWGKMCRKPVE